MLAIKGYYDGKSFKALEKVEIEKNQEVIITILDTKKDFNRKSELYKKHIGKLSNESLVEIEEALKETEKVDIDEW